MSKGKGRRFAYDYCIGRMKYRDETAHSGVVVASSLRGALGKVERIARKMGCGLDRITQVEMAGEIQA